MKKILFILFFAVFLFGMGNVLAAPYSISEDRECVDGECIATLYSSATNVFEEGEWKHYTDAKSLKDKEGFGIEWLEVDKDYPLEVVDFNATSITVDLKKWTILNTEIPLRIWELKDEFSDVTDFKNTYTKVKDECEKFTILDLGSKRKTYNFEEGAILEFGPNSSSLTLDYNAVTDDAFVSEEYPTTNYGSYDELFVGTDDYNDYEAYLRWDISSLQDTIIKTSTLKLYCIQQVWLYHDVQPFDTANTWFEGNITWNNKPSSVGGATDTVATDDCGGGWVNFIVTPIISTDVNASSLVSNMVLKGYDGSSDTSWTRFDSKEGSVTRRPKLYVSFNYKVAQGITFPADGASYEYLPTFLNWTLDNSTNLDMCIYELNGAANVTANCMDYYTSISSIEGANTISLYVNNTAGFSNSSKITYTANIPFPVVNIIGPQPIVYGMNITSLNYTYISDYPDKCWFSIDKGVTNSSTQVCGTNWSSGMIGYEGVNNWTVFMNSTSGNNEQSQDNVVFSIDTTQPSLNITYPLTYVNYQRLYQNLGITFTHSDDNPSMCWQLYEGVNTTVTCGDYITYVNITNSTPTTEHNLIMFANDTGALEVQDSTAWTYKFIETALEYNQTTYETATEKYIVDLRSTGLESVTATLNYNGTVYAATKTGTNLEMVFTSTGPTFEEGDTGNKSFFWNISYGNEYIQSPTYYQQVSDLNFQLCNGTGHPYLNFTFKDEETGNYISSELLTTNLEYWLGDGTQKKYLTFSNTTSNPSYDFCLNVNYTLHHDGQFRYSNISYPQRTYTTNGDLTNDTTFKVLYLLHEDDGIYSSISVVDGLGDSLIGVDVTLERQFSGVWTVLGIDTTDSAGLVTFWVNPDYDHRLTFSKSGCTGITSTIRPTQTQYTQTMICGTGAEIYVGPLEGLKYARKPSGGILQPGLYNFTYQIVSSRNNIANASMAIVFSNGSILASTWDSCSPSGCTIFMPLTLQQGWDLKGRYYVDIGNGSILLEGDSHWKLIVIDTSGNNLMQLGRDLILVFNNWESSDMTGDFNRLVFSFFLIGLLMCIVNWFTGADSVSPGSFMIFMTAIVFMGSIVNGPTGEGFFYFNNLSSIDFLNNYILFILLLFITIGQIINTQRQASR